MPRSVALGQALPQERPADAPAAEPGSDVEVDDEALVGPGVLGHRGGVVEYDRDQPDRVTPDLGQPGLDRACSHGPLEERLRLVHGLPGQGLGAHPAALRQELETEPRERGEVVDGGQPGAHAAMVPDDDQLRPPSGQSGRPVEVRRATGVARSSKT